MSIIVEYLFSFGSMVQKGKFSAGAALFVRTLKKVDLPTLGTPTIPIRKLVPRRPINGLRSGTPSCFFGGISGQIFCLNENKRKTTIYQRQIERRVGTGGK